MVRLNCNKSQNCVSHCGNLNYVIKVEARSTEVQITFFIKLIPVNYCFFFKNIDQIVQVCPQVARWAVVLPTLQPIGLPVECLRVQSD